LIEIFGYNILDPSFLFLLPIPRSRITKIGVLNTSFSFPLPVLQSCITKIGVVKVIEICLACVKAWNIVSNIRYIKIFLLISAN
jgi:hypothetical protein